MEKNIIKNVKKRKPLNIPSQELGNVAETYHGENIKHTMKNKLAETQFLFSFKV